MAIDKHNMVQNEIMDLGKRFGFLPKKEVWTEFGKIDVIWFSIQDKREICAFEIELRKDPSSNKESILKLGDVNAEFKFIVTNGNELSPSALKSLENKEIMVLELSYVYNWFDKHIPDKYRKNKELIEKAMNIEEQYGKVNYRLGIKMESGGYLIYPPSTEIFLALIDEKKKLSIPISKLKKGSIVVVNKDTLPLEAKVIFGKDVNKMIKKYFNVLPDFGKRVFEGRKKLSLTQVELIKKIEEKGKTLSPSTISQWELGNIMLPRDRKNMKYLALILNDKKLLEFYEDDEIWYARDIIAVIRRNTGKIIKTEIFSRKNIHKKYEKSSADGKRHPEVTKIMNKVYRNIKNQVNPEKTFDKIIDIRKIPDYPKKILEKITGVSKDIRLKRGIVTVDQILKDVLAGKEIKLPSVKKLLQTSPNLKLYLTHIHLLNKKEISDFNNILNHLEIDHKNISNIKSFLSNLDRNILTYSAFKIYMDEKLKKIEFLNSQARAGTKKFKDINSIFENTITKNKKLFDKYSLKVLKIEKEINEFYSTIEEDTDFKIFKKIIKDKNFAKKIMNKNLSKKLKERIIKESKLRKPLVLDEPKDLAEKIMKEFSIEGEIKRLKYPFREGGIFVVYGKFDKLIEKKLDRNYTKNYPRHFQDITIRFKNIE